VADLPQGKQTYLTVTRSPEACGTVTAYWPRLRDARFDSRVMCASLRDPVPVVCLIQIRRYFHGPESGADCYKCSIQMLRRLSVPIFFSPPRANSIKNFPVGNSRK
jgi:hypothetical protein